MILECLLGMLLWPASKCLVNTSCTGFLGFQTLFMLYSDKHEVKSVNKCLNVNNFCLCQHTSS